MVELLFGITRPDEGKILIDGAATSLTSPPKAIAVGFALCPEDRLLVETDAPFLAPVPRRGRPNQPAWVAEVGTAVARAKEMAPEAVAECSAAVARRVFALR